MKRSILLKSILLCFIGIFIFPALHAQDCVNDTTNVAATTCDPAQVGITQAILSNTFGCDSVVLTSTTLLPSDTTNVAATTCDPAQVGITQAILSNTFGCDSVVLTSTTLLPSDTTNVAATTCDPAQVGITQAILSNTFGCDSVILTSTTLLPSDTTNVAATTCDPAQVGITQAILSNTFGCDSVILTSTTLLPSDTTNVAATTCDPAQVGITQAILSNTFGCDSVILTSTTLLPSDTTNVAATTCDPAQVGITMQVFSNTFGCDSVVLRSTTLLPSDTTNVAATTCDPAQVGITMQVFSNTFGCDSVVLRSTTLLPSDTTNVAATTCDPAQVGITQAILSNTFGCDSVILTSTTLLPSDTTNVAATTCDPAQVGITMQVFSNTFGCDSIVVTLTTLITPENPVIESISASIDPVQVGNTISAAASFNASNLTNAIWDWGDNSSSDGLVNDQVVTGTHNYQLPGVYAISLTITDQCFKTDTAIYQYVVIYDPSSGFVTGGGWINSPMGAYVNDPLLNGKANFGFVAKYKKGSNVPAGNTEFQFKAGDLNFKSDVYDWLVVAGEKAKFKGEGTINHVGNYGFMISAIDGDKKDEADKFRIKIWEKGSDLIVYDNQFEADDNADPNTNLGGGSIVVHNSKADKNNRIADVSDLERFNEVVKLSVYPNPVSDIVNIEFPSDYLLSDEMIELHLFNLTGVDLMKTHRRTVKGRKLELDILDLPAGIYILTIPTGESIVKHKITKL